MSEPQPIVRTSQGPVTDKGYPVCCIPTPIKLRVLCEVLKSIDVGFARRGIRLYLQGDELGQPWIMVDNADLPKLDQGTEE
jgi:hypothetical protein